MIFNILEPKGGLDLTWHDIISFALWIIQYSNCYHIGGSRSTRPSQYHEPTVYMELDNSKSRRAYKIKLKNICYFIYSLWYRKPWHKFFISINYNWLWLDIKTIQVNDHTTHDNDNSLQFLYDSTSRDGSHTIK